MKHEFPEELFHFMSEFDDDEAPDGAWQAMLEDSVRRWNRGHGTDYDVNEVLHAYIARCDSRARLIDAAPDLLEALEKLADLAQGFSVSGVYFTEFHENESALSAAFTAIAKATGYRS